MHVATSGEPIAIFAAWRGNTFILLDDLIVRLSSDCPWRDDPRGSGCGAQFADLPPRRPPDMPAARRLRVVAGGKA